MTPISKTGLRILQAMAEGRALYLETHLHDDGFSWTWVFLQKPDGGFGPFFQGDWDTAHCVVTRKLIRQRLIEPCGRAYIREADPSDDGDTDTITQGYELTDLGRHVVATAMTAAANEKESSAAGLDQTRDERSK